MFHNALQKLLTGVAILSLAAISPVTATGNVYVLSDLENATNENAFGQYWYVYDDHEDAGNTAITNLTRNADSTYTFVPTKDVGNSVAGGTPGYGAKIDFKLGTVNPGDGSATWGSMAAMGTMLAPTGEYFDLTGAQKIEFYAKVERPTGTAASVDLRVEVCTQELAADNGYYHIVIPIDGTWKMYTIPLDTAVTPFGRLEQWDWSISNNGAQPFNIKKVSQIQWCVSEDGNVTAWKDASGSLFLDDISISPFTPHFPDEIETSKLVAAGSGAPATSLMSSFDVNMKNALGFFGYCYTDIDANPTAESSSSITAGATLNTETGKYVLAPSDGGVNATKCASITFELGTTFIEGANTVQPFVGIGTNLVATDASGAPMEVRDLSAATAVYFDYKLEGANVKFVTFEYSTDQSFGNEGAVYYVKLPNTNGTWQGATVDLGATAAELVLPKWKDVTPSPLDQTKSTKFQWKAQGAARSTGTLAIDNVYIPGYTPGVIHFGNKPTRKAAFNVKQLNNLAQVSFALPQNVNSAKVDLVSMQGKVLASQSVQRNDGGKYQVAFPTGRIANGSYFVKVNYDNKDVKSSMISIIR